MRQLEDLLRKLRVSAEAEILAKHERIAQLEDSLRSSEAELARLRDGLVKQHSANRILEVRYKRVTTGYDRV